MHEDLVLLQAGKSIRRSRVLERQLALAMRVALAVVAVAVLSLAGYLYQGSQTRQKTALLERVEVAVAVNDIAGHADRG